MIFHRFGGISFDQIGAGAIVGKTIVYANASTQRWETTDLTNLLSIVFDAEGNLTGLSVIPRTNTYASLKALVGSAGEIAVPSDRAGTLILYDGSTVGGSDVAGLPQPTDHGSVARETFEYDDPDGGVSNGAIATPTVPTIAASVVESWEYEITVCLVNESAETKVLERRLTVVSNGTSLALDAAVQTIGTDYGDAANFSITIAVAANVLTVKATNTSNLAARYFTDVRIRKISLAA